jgi:CheY-like chemotaxis protein
MPCTGCILIIDDDPDVREVLRHHIEELGCTVAVAVDGVHGLEVLERCPRPCLVLLDVNMPRMDGVGFAQAVRRDDRMSALPIVSMSAGLQCLGPPEVHCHLGKPFGLERLEPQIERFCVEPTRAA